MVSETFTIRGSKLQDGAGVLKDRHLRKAKVMAHILKPKEGRENYKNKNKTNTRVQESKAVWKITVYCRNQCSY